MTLPANTPAPKEWPDLPQSLDAALGFPAGWREQTNGSLKQQSVWANGFHNCRDQVLTAFEADPLCSASERDALAAEILALRKRVEAQQTALCDIAISANDDDGFTSDGHERCVDRATAAYRATGDA